MKPNLGADTPAHLQPELLDDLLGPSLSTKQLIISLHLIQVNMMPGGAPCPLEPINTGGEVIETGKKKKILDKTDPTELEEMKNIEDQHSGTVEYPPQVVMLCPLNPPLSDIEGQRGGQNLTLQIHTQRGKAGLVSLPPHWLMSLGPLPPHWLIDLVETHMYLQAAT